MNDPGIQEIKEASELSETLKEMNDDSVERDSRMSKIDLKTRLHILEINSILAMDSLVGLKVLPTICLAFTRQKKRLNVSLEGKGREEMVEISAAKRESDRDKLAPKTNFFGMPQR